MRRSQRLFAGAMLAAGIVATTQPGHADIIYSGEVTDTSNPREIRVGPNTTGSLTVDGGSVLNMEAGTATDDFGPALFFSRQPGSVGTGLIDGSGSAINIIGSESPTQTIANSFVHIGREGTGSLTIQNGGSLTITDPFAEDGSSELHGETVQVGRDGGTGTLTLNDGSLTIDSKGAFVQIGRNGGTGTVSVQNGSSVLISDHDAASGTGANTTVGFSGSGSGTFSLVDSTWTVHSDEGSSRFFVGRDNAETTGSALISGATAQLNVTGPDSAIRVGVFGQGSMTVTNDAAVTVGGDSAVMTLGLEPGSSGTLTVSDGGNVEIGDGSGFLTVGGAFADFGQPESGAGLAIVTGASSRISVVNDVEIGAPLIYGGGIGNGTVIVSNGGLLEADRILIGVGGTLAGNGNFAANVHLNGGTFTPGQSPGTAHVDGDFFMTAGELIIEVAGLAAGQFDVVEITGSAELLGGTVLFDFIDGFLPSTGDVIKFLTALGPIVVDPAVNFAFSGVAPGFLFDVDFSDGGLLFTALNDARPTNVPEPASLLLFLAGLGAIVILCLRPGRAPITRSA